MQSSLASFKLKLGIELRNVLYTVLSSHVHTTYCPYREHELHLSTLTEVEAFSMLVWVATSVLEDLLPMSLYRHYDFLRIIILFLVSWI